MLVAWILRPEYQDLSGAVVDDGMRPEADVGDRGRNLGMMRINECRDRRPKSLRNISNFSPRQRRALSRDRAGCSTLGQASHMPASKISLRMIASSRSLFLACVPLSSSVPQGAVLRQRQRNVNAELMRGFGATTSATGVLAGALFIGAADGGCACWPSFSACRPYLRRQPGPSN